MHPLRSPAHARTSAGVEFRLEGNFLTARFSVRSDRPNHLNPSLPLGSSQWGLWDWDVVELFLAVSGDPSNTPYYEFQVSPLGQFLELEIFEPRKRFNRDFVSGFGHEASRGEGGAWEASMRVPLDRLGWDGDPSRIRGNAFAILGAPAERTYWSLYLDPQEKPDFHLPDRFRSLLE